MGGLPILFSWLIQSLSFIYQSDPSFTIISSTHYFDWHSICTVPVTWCKNFAFSVVPMWAWISLASNWWGVDSVFRCVSPLTRISPVTSIPKMTIFWGNLIWVIITDISVSIFTFIFFSTCDYHHYQENARNLARKKNSVFGFRPARPRHPVMKKRNCAGFSVKSARIWWIELVLIVGCPMKTGLHTLEATWFRFDYMLN